MKYLYYFFVIPCHSSHKQACGMNDILLEQGLLLGDGSPLIKSLGGIDE